MNILEHEYKKGQYIFRDKKTNNHSNAESKQRDTCMERTQCTDEGKNLKRTVAFSYEGVRH